jgi:hypothetical protein
LQVVDIEKNIQRVCEPDAVDALRIVFGISAFRCDIVISSRATSNTETSRRRKDENRKAPNKTGKRLPILPLLSHRHDACGAQKRGLARHSGYAFSLTPSVLGIDLASSGVPSYLFLRSGSTEPTFGSSPH